jgi:hypothetical protein
MNLPSMKPPARGWVSYGLKLGRDLPEIMSGGRFPIRKVIVELFQ